MATRHYEASTSGMNFDRFLDNFDDTTISKMKRKYWTAKQMLKTKLGHKEDDFLRASDADLDARLALFTSIRTTSDGLLLTIDQYQAHIIDAAQTANELGRYLKKGGREERRKHLSQSMVALGRALVFSAHRLAAVRKPIVRFYDELHVFCERAVADCTQTVEAVERARTEYRGSLLWMQNKSLELDPDAPHLLDSFREAQTVVKANKERLDSLKAGGEGGRGGRRSLQVDTLQKVQLLSASRVNLLVHLLGSYAESLSTYYERTAGAFAAIASNLSAYEHYDFEILTDLVEPSRKVAEKVRSDSVDEKEEAVVEEAVSDLLDLGGDEEGAFRDFLFGRSSPDERVDSPLGILDESPRRRGEEEGKDSLSLLSIGPLLHSRMEVPRLPPPPPLADPMEAGEWAGLLSQCDPSAANGINWS